MPILWKWLRSARRAHSTSGSPSLKFSRTPTRKHVDRYLSLLCGSMARNQKAGNRPGHSPLLFHNDLRIFGISRVEGRSRLKRSSKGRFDRFSQFPGRKTLKHLDQSVHLGFAHAVQNCQAGRIRFGESCFRNVVFAQRRCVAKNQRSPLRAPNLQAHRSIMVPQESVLRTQARALA
jgi:hypothetical protein